jgi:hypothetical protein
LPAFKMISLENFRMIYFYQKILLFLTNPVSKLSFNVSFL